MVGWGYMGGAAPAWHDAAVAPIRGLDPSVLQAAEDRAAAASPEDLAAALVAELDALIAGGGDGGGERPTPNP